MVEDIYPVQWSGRQAVVAIPEHVSVSNAGHIRDELLSVINRGATALIADMTATISCDHAGAQAVARAHQRAVISGTELRLVVTAPIVSRVLIRNGLDRLVSLYPSLEAAMAASVPSAGPARQVQAAGTRPDGHAPPRRAGWGKAPALAAGPPDRNGAALTAVGELLDALRLRDGVAVVDDYGALVLASARMEEMFSYSRGELAGQPVESLVPDGLQAAHRGHRAGYARAPAARPMGDRGPLAGLRKDGTTFPVQISLTPVTTPAGYLTLTVIRDGTRVPRLADLAGTVFTADRAPGGLELLDAIITGLFHVGLSLQAALDLPAEVSRPRITEALGHLDDTIREIRDAAFRSRGAPPRDAQLNGAG